jgi:hypothetical protein
MDVRFHSMAAGDTPRGYHRAAVAASSDWPTYLYDSARTSSNPGATAIGPANAGQLHVAWTTQVNRTLHGSMIVVNGVVYVGSEGGYLEAINASTGVPLSLQSQPQWALPFLGNTSYSRCGAPGPLGASHEGVIATPTLAGGRLYEAGGNTSFYTLGLDGTVLHRTDIGNSSTKTQWYFDRNWASPLVSGSFAYQGTSAICEFDHGQGLRYIQGQLLQIDLATGSITHVWNVTKGSTLSDTGGSIWSTPSIDTATNIVWATTGNENLSSQTPANCEYPRSIVALNATTLAYIGSYQVGGTGADLDFGAGPTVFHDANGTRLVGANNKDGRFYALNATPGPATNCSSLLRLAWSRAFGAANNPGPISPASFDGTRLYVASDGVGNTSGVVAALRPSDGAVLWSHSMYTPYPASIHAGLTTANGLVFVGAVNNTNGGGYGPDGELQVLDSATGNLLYQHSLGLAVSGAVVVAEGKVFAASGSEADTGPGYVTAFDVPAATAWENGTAREGAAAAPPGSSGGSVAYDVADGEYVYFGGCESVACPSNQTWAYRAGWWTNLTDPARAPPAREKGTMTYDANLGGVLLIGGCGAKTCPLNDTWEFVGGRWTNLTGTSCPVASNCPSAVFGATLTWIDFPGPVPAAQNLSLLFGGCEDRGCTNLSSGTFGFVAPSGWKRLAPTKSPPALMGAAAAFDDQLRSLVLFGGDRRCATGLCDTNSTWRFGANGTWVNQTRPVSGGPEPAAQSGASLVRDPASDDLVLVSGWVASGAALLIDTWRFQCQLGTCDWRYAGQGNGPTGRAWMAYGTNGSGLDPLLIGGTAAAAGPPIAQWWELGVPLQANVSSNPNPVPAGVTLNLATTTSGGVAPMVGYGWVLADGTTYRAAASNLGMLAPAGGTVNGTAIAVDSAWTVAGAAFSIAVVSQLRVSVSTSASPTEVNRSVAFEATVPNRTLGGPFGLRWTFGDGATAVGPVVAHAFPLPGTFVVRVSVTDSLGDRNSSSVPVVVAPLPSVTLVANRTTIDAGEAVGFVATPQGGVGPIAIVWNFGDGSGATGTSAVQHDFLSEGATDVTVELTDVFGSTAVASVLLGVNPRLTTSIASHPAANATVGARVEFVGNSLGGTPSPAGDTFQWTFGDGTSDVGPVVAHSFATAGTYSVTVVANDSTGGRATANLSITVHPLPGAPCNPCHTDVGSGSGVPLWEVALLIAVPLALGGALGWRTYRRRGHGR